MYSSSSLSSSSLLRAHIRQDVSLIFVSEYSSSWDFSLLKKYSYIFTSFLAFFAFLPHSSYASSWEEIQKEFIVTAYYSPLPDQSWYAKGTYEAEKRLNGNGIAGANGKPVFMGMIAAPKTYDFGTRIYFEWLGVGIVEDRGWAIVKAWERGQSADRIDIWMGSGESWLIRALRWGKRKVTGTILSTTTQSLLDFRDIDTGKVDINMYGRVLGSPSGYISEDILSMFDDLGYSSTEDVRAMITEFQKDHSIIQDEKDEWAWVYGPKTRSALAREYAKYIELRDTEIKKIEAEKNLLISARDSWDNNYETARIKVSEIGTPKRGEKGKHIAELQSTLKANGYYKGKTSGIMSGATILAVKKLQKIHGLTQTGSIDPLTRDILLEMMTASV